MSVGLPSFIIKTLIILNMSHFKKIDYLIIFLTVSLSNVSRSDLAIRYSILYSLGIFLKWDPIWFTYGLLDPFISKSIGRSFLHKNFLLDEVLPFIRRRSFKFNDVCLRYDIFSFELKNLLSLIWAMKNVSIVIFLVEMISRCYCE